MALIDNIVSYWTLDETSGTRADSHGNNDLTDNNTVGYGTGKISNAADFEYSNSEYLSIADGSQSGLDGMSNLSVSLWAWVESTAINYPNLISKWSDTARGWAVVILSGKFYFYTNPDGASGTTTSVAATNSLSTGTWYHLVGTFTSGTNGQKLYINGSLDAQATPIGSVINNNSAAFQMGNSPGQFGGYSSNYFDGLIDEVGIWNRVLSGTEVSELYNSGNGFAYPFSATTNTTNFFHLM